MYSIPRPGHAGVKGNEMTDALAREGSFNQFHGPQSYIPILLSMMKRDIVSLFNRELEKEEQGWSSIDSCWLF